MGIYGIRPDGADGLSGANMRKSRHDTERDRIAADWLVSPSFVCDVCDAESDFPRNLNVATEVQYAGRLRADIGAIGSDGQVVGVVEVIDSHGPTPHALSEQGKLQFAYYRILDPPTGPKRRRIVDEISEGRFSYPSAEQREYDAAAWLCSAECLTFFEALKGAHRTNDWDAPRCDICSGYLHDNQISSAEFRDWAYDPYTAFCIHCAARSDASEMQWRAPGELAGGDPREWTPGKDADPADLFLAYCQAAFWSKVWSNRSSELAEPNAYHGNQHEIAEDATAKRLPLVNAAIDVGEWENAMNLLLPIGAPGWAAYEDEPERMLAFRADNCSGTASAWNRLMPLILGALPSELVAIIKESKEHHQKNIPLPTIDPNDEMRRETVPMPVPNRTQDEQDDLAKAWQELNKRFGQ